MGRAKNSPFLFGANVKFKVGQKLLTKHNTSWLVNDSLIEITKISGDRIHYKYLTIPNDQNIAIQVGEDLYDRNLLDFANETIIPSSLIMELI